MGTRVKLHAIQQHPSEKAFWEGEKLWRLERLGVETEFHARDREEAKARVLEWYPDAVFYAGGKNVPPRNRKRKNQ